jgi:hypothetical protein
MNKLKMFFIAATLALTTVGVFAGKTKYFATPPNLYVQTGASSYVSLATGSVVGTHLMYGVPGTQVTINGIGGPYNVVTNTTGSTYVGVVTASF